MKHRLKTFIKLIAGASVAMYLINKYVESSALIRHLLKTDGGCYFNWRHGKIFYTKRGSGDPLLLIHDLYPSSSQKEWDEVKEELSKKYTVYAIDLLGCGRSDKPNIIYSNYLYVQMLSDFIQKVIKEKTAVMCTGKSGAFVVMTAKLHPDQISDLTLVSPESFGRVKAIPDMRSKIAKALLVCPILGTFLYYLLMSSNQIDYNFKEQYFYNPFSVSQSTENAYYEAAHMQKGNGRYLLACIKGNYVNIDIQRAFSELSNNICLIFGEAAEYSQDIAKSYKNTNSSVRIEFIKNTRMLPQLEAPKEFLKQF